MAGDEKTTNPFEVGDKTFTIYSLEELLQSNKLEDQEQGKQLLLQVYDHYCKAFPNEDERESFKTFLERLNDPNQTVPMIAPVIMDTTDPDNPKVVSYALVEKYPGTEGVDRKKATKPVGLFAYVVKDMAYKEIKSKMVRDLAVEKLKSQGVGFVGWESDLLSAGSNPKETSMPAWKRWGVVSAFGSEVLNFDWVQPPLERDGESVPLILFAHPIGKDEQSGVVQFFKAQEQEDGRIVSLEDAMVDETMRNAIADELEAYVESVYSESQRVGGLKDYQQDVNYQNAMTQIEEIRAGTEVRPLTIPLTQAIRDGLVKDVFKDSPEKARFVEEVFKQCQAQFTDDIAKQKTIMLTVAALSDEKWGGRFTKDFLLVGDNKQLPEGMLDKLSKGFASYVKGELVASFGKESEQVEFVQKVFGESKNKEMAMLKIAELYVEKGYEALFKSEYAQGFVDVFAMVENAEKFDKLKPILPKIKSPEQLEFVSMVLELSTDKDKALEVLSGNVEGHKNAFKPEYAAFFVEVMERGQGGDETKNAEFALKVMEAANKAADGNPLKTSYDQAKTNVREGDGAKDVAREQQKALSKMPHSDVEMQKIVDEMQNIDGFKVADRMKGKIALIGFANSDLFDKFSDKVSTKSGATTTPRVVGGDKGMLP